MRRIATLRWKCALPELKRRLHPPWLVSYWWSGNVVVWVVKHLKTRLSGISESFKQVSEYIAVFARCSFHLYKSWRWVPWTHSSKHSPNSTRSSVLEVLATGSSQRRHPGSQRDGEGERFLWGFPWAVGDPQLAGGFHGTSQSKIGWELGYLGYLTQESPMLLWTMAPWVLPPKMGTSSATLNSGKIFCGNVNAARPPSAVGWLLLHNRIQVWLSWCTHNS